MKSIDGFCYVGEPPNGEITRMDCLRPGDTFRFLPMDDPAMAVVLEDAGRDEATEQGMNLLLAMIGRAKVYVYEDVDAPTMDGRAGCRAVECE